MGNWNTLPADAPTEFLAVLLPLMGNWNGRKVWETWWNIALTTPNGKLKQFSSKQGSTHSWLTTPNGKLKHYDYRTVFVRLLVLTTPNGKLKLLTTDMWRELFYNLTTPNGKLKQFLAVVCMKSSLLTTPNGKLKHFFVNPKISYHRFLLPLMGNWNAIVAFFNISFVILLPLMGNWNFHWDSLRSLLQGLTTPNGKLKHHVDKQRRSN